MNILKVCFEHYKNRLVMIVYYDDFSYKIYKIKLKDLCELYNIFISIGMNCNLIKRGKYE